MASLNLMERTVEATILYCGAAASGRTTNLMRLGEMPAAGALAASTVTEDGHASLDVRPEGFGTINGCALTFLLRELPDGSRADLSEADGVVFVAASDPEGLSSAQAELAALRERLPSDRDVPLVIQLNKRDDPRAVSVSEAVSRLGAEPWPCVEACASEGTGVIETLERAARNVSHALGAARRSRPPARRATLPPPQSAPPRQTGSVLPSRPPLSSVRPLAVGSLVPLAPPLRSSRPPAPQAPRPPAGAADPVLESAILAIQSLLSEQREEMRQRQDASEAALTALARQVSASHAHLEQLSETLRGADSTQADIATTLRSLVHAVRSSSEGARADAERTHGAVEASFRALDLHAAGLADRLDGITSAARATAAETQHVRAELAGLAEIVAELKGDARLYTTEVGAIVANTRRALEACVKNVERGQDASAKDLRQIVSAVRDLQPSLEPIASAVAALKAELGALPPKLTRAISPALEEHGVAVDHTLAGLAEQLTAISRETAGLGALLVEQQRKKGWFG